MSQNDYTGKNLKPWPVLLDHYSKSCVIYGSLPRVVPAHNTPNKISREHQENWGGDYELLHFIAVVGNSLQPCFLIVKLTASL